jgi:outer membrane protein assembly factor BamB
MRTCKKSNPFIVYSYLLPLILIAALVLVNFNFMMDNDIETFSVNVASDTYESTSTIHSTRTYREPTDFWKSRGDLNNTGFVDSKAPNYFNELWSRSVGAPIDSTPVVAGNMVYFGGTDRNIYAMDKYNGGLIWTRSTNNLGGPLSGDEIVSTAAVADGILFIGCKDKNLFALDAEDGSLLWNYTTNGEVHGSPTVVDNNVIFGSYDGTLYALDTATGQEEWTFQAGYNIYSTPAVVNDVVYFGTESLQGQNDPCVYAIDLQTGDDIWNFTTASGRGIHSSLAVANNTVYFGAIDHNVYALDMTTGTELWNFTTGDVIYSSPAVDTENGVVYAGSNDEYIYALPMTDPNGDGKIDSGEVYWSYQTYNQLSFSSPVVADGKLFIADFNGYYYALNTTLDTITSDQRKVWGGYFGDGISSSLTITDGILYLTEQSGKVYAIASTDLLIYKHQVRVSDLNPFEGEYLEIEITVYNNGTTNMTGELLFQDWDYTQAGKPKNLIEEVWFEIDVGEYKKFDTIWKAEAGEHHLTAYLNSSQPSDSYIKNNFASWILTDIFELYSNGWAMFQNDTAHTGQSWRAPRTNKTEWTFQTDGAIRSSPAVAKGRVFITSLDGYIYSITEKEKTDIWNTSVGSPIHSSPAFIASGQDSDSVYDRIFFGADDGNVYCLDLNDGSVMWSYATGSQVRASPMVINGIVYIASNDGNLYALDEDGLVDGDQGTNDTGTSDGDLIWTKSIGTVSQGSPAAVLEDNKLYLGTEEGKVYALDRLTGSTVWEQDIGASAAVVGSPSIDNNMVYFGAHDNKVYALDADNGDVVWSKSTGDDIDGSAALDPINNNLVIGSKDGKLYAYDVDAGVLVWSYETGSPITSSPIVADGRVFFANDDGMVYSVDSEGNTDQTTDLIWKFDAGENIYSSPTIANNALYIGTESGLLYRLGSPNVPPVAKINEPLNQSVYFVDEIITFNASKSTDLEDTKLRYNWSTVRVIETELKTETRYLYDGYDPVTTAILPADDYTVKLRVTDPMGGMSNATCVIEVFEPQTVHFQNFSIPADCFLHFGGSGIVDITKISNPSSKATGSLGLFQTYEFRSYEERFKIGWANISVSLDNAQLPEGLNLSRLKMYTWDASDGKWVKIENSGLIKFSEDEQRVWAKGDEIVTNQTKIYSPGTFDNSPPELELVDSGVYPEEGSDYDTFTFKVVYTDADNDGPIPANGGKIMACINGDLYPMNVSDASHMNFTKGKEYILQLTGAEIGVGSNNTFYFYAHDGTYKAVGDTSEITGPVVRLGTPVADAGIDITVQADTVFQLDGSGSSDDGTITSYSWDFNDQEDVNGDGIYDNDDERSGATTTWKYSEPGEYIITLTVRDDQGIIAKDTIKVNVTEKDEEDEGLESSDLVVYSLIVVIIIIIILIVVFLMIRKKIKEEQEYEKFKKRKKKGKSKKVTEEEEEE